MKIICSIHCLVFFAVLAASGVRAENADAGTDEAKKTGAALTSRFRDRDGEAGAALIYRGRVGRIAV